MIKRAIYQSLAWLARRFPLLIWHLRVFKRSGRFLNLQKPQGVFEKMIQIYLSSDQYLMANLADKYAVRDYVAEKIGVDYLNELYCCYDNEEDIDVEELPDKFVLKTTNGCATNIIVKDKSKLDIEKMRAQMKEWLHFPYGELTGQLHYSLIKPRIIAERYIQQDSKGSSLIDYKFYCINGRVEYLLVCMNRQAGTHLYDAIICDRNGVYHPQYSKHRLGEEYVYSVPPSFEEMKGLAEVLASPFKFVRVDFYEVSGVPVFGEITFTPGLDAHTKELEKSLLEKLSIIKK